MPNLLQGGRGRPLHPMLVHFPVALYPTSLVFDALSHLSEDGNPFVVGAFWLIVIALVAAEELPQAAPPDPSQPEAPRTEAPPADPDPDRPAGAG